MQSCINTYYNGFSGNQTQHSFFVNYMIPTMTLIMTDIKNQIYTPVQINAVENPQPNSYIYSAMGTNPSVKDYSTILPWNWNNYFTHFCFNGLHNCTSYPFIYPIGSPNALNYIQYISVGILNLEP